MARGNKKPCDTQTNLPKFSAFSFKAQKIQYNIPTVYISEIHCCIFKNINLPTNLQFCKKNPLKIRRGWNENVLLEAKKSIKLHNLIHVQ
jgi:hypothetical protein